MSISRLILSLILAIVLLPLSSAKAAPVRVQVGKDEAAGGGWLYSDDTGCYVVTARHLVFPNSVFSPPLLTSSSGEQGEGVEISQPSSERADEVPDVARLRVEGPLKHDCGDALGFEHLDDTLSRVENAHLPLYLNRIGQAGGDEAIALELTAINKNKLQFTVRSVDSNLPIMETDSGFPVRLHSDQPLDRGLPLGLLYEALGQNEAMVFRLDAIRQLFPIRLRSNAADASPGPFKRPELVTWSGVTVDPACGPINTLIDYTRCGWRAEPQPGQTTVDLDLKIASVPTEISEVSMVLESGSSIAGCEISVTDDTTVDNSTVWEPVRYCSSLSNALPFTCRFLQRSATAFRLRIAGLNGGIRRIEWR